jgi:hypothetical protein
MQKTSAADAEEVSQLSVVAGEHNTRSRRNGDQNAKGDPSGCHSRTSVPENARTALDPLPSISPNRCRLISSLTDVPKKVEYKSL